MRLVQPRVLQSNGRVVGQVLHKAQSFLSKAVRLGALQVEHPNDLALADDGYRQFTLRTRQPLKIVGVFADVRHQRWLTGSDDPASDAHIGAPGSGALLQDGVGWIAPQGQDAKGSGGFIGQSHQASRSVGALNSTIQHQVNDTLEVQRGREFVVYLGNTGEFFHAAG